MAAWVAHRTHTSGPSARRLQRLGVAREQRWHRVGTALAGGQVSLDHGHVMVAALDDLTDAFSLVEADAEEWSASWLAPRRTRSSRPPTSGPVSWAAWPSGCWRSSRCD
ncbi:13E12 repeat family protein [Nocardioides ochotonae]|uniref:DUF222 domain-containing protein n=1 Tax=Nocardioides ochotonae TaxID=2685869 RepID=UPI00140C5EFC